MSVDPSSVFGLPPREEIDAAVSSRALRRLLDRQERGRPITVNAVAKIVRDELNRFYDEQIARWHARN